MAKQIPFVLIGAAAGTALTLLAAQIPINAAAKSSVHAEEYRVLELFDDAFEQVRQNYVERPDDKKLIENAINGMMAALGDFYYLDAKSASHTVACAASGCPSASDVGLALHHRRQSAEGHNRHRRFTGRQGRAADGRRHRLRSTISRSTI